MPQPQLPTPPLQSVSVHACKIGVLSGCGVHLFVRTPLEQQIHRPRVVVFGGVDQSRAAVFTSQSVHLQNWCQGEGEGEGEGEGGVEWG